MLSRGQKGQVCQVYISNSTINQLHTGDVYNFGNRDDSSSENEDDEIKLDLENIKEKLQYEYRCSDDIQPLTGQTTCKVLEDFIDIELREVNKKTRKIKAQSVQLKDILTPGNEKLKPPSTICIEGEAGYGKTTLVKKLVYDWASLSENVNYLSHFDLVFLVNVSCLKVEQELLDYVVESPIFNELLKEKNKNNFAPIRQLLYDNANKILFILDGLDIMPPEYKMFEKLKSKMPQSTILVTQQPFANQAGEMYKRFEKNLVIQGFEKESIEKFIEIFFTDDMDSKLKVKNCYLTLEHFEKILESSLSCPLLLYVCCDLFKRERSFSPKNLTEVIEKFFLDIKEKYVSRLQHGKEKGYEKFDNVMKTFGKLALQNIEAKSSFYTYQDISALLTDSKEILRFGFLKGSLESTEICYQPLLKIFNEFLAAFYISSHCDQQEVLKQLLKEIFEKPELSHAKSKKGGSKASILIIFIIHLLKDKSYLFFRFLPLTIYEDFSSLCQVLSTSLLNERNIEEVMHSRIVQRWETEWFFEKSNERNKDNESILINILKHPECPVKEFVIDSYFILMLYSKEIKAFRVFCNALSKNRSIKMIHIQRNRKKPINFSTEYYLNSFKLIFQSMTNFNYIKYDLEIADDSNLSYTLLMNLFEHVQKFPNLETLQINSLLRPLDYLCDSFHSKSNSHENTPIKHKGAFIKDDHIKQLKESLQKQDNNSLKKLFLPQLRITQHALQKLVEIVKENPIHHLSLPFLKLTDSEQPFTEEKIFNLKPDIGEKNGAYRETSTIVRKEYDAPLVSSSLVLLFDAFTQETSKLNWLNLKGRAFSSEEIHVLSCFLQNNKTIECLNLADCLDSVDKLSDLVPALKTNHSLKQVNLSARTLALQADDLISFCSIWSCNEETQDKACKIKELILSGWTFTVNEETIATAISAIFNSSLEILCIKNTKLILQLKQQELRIWIPKTENPLKKSDIQNVQVSKDSFPSIKLISFPVERKVSHSLSIDSGFAEPLYDESMNEQFETGDFLETIFPGTEFIKSSNSLPYVF